jgi:hypothetical protein
MTPAGNTEAQAFCFVMKSGDMEPEAQQEDDRSPAELGLGYLGDHQVARRPA